MIEQTQTQQDGDEPISEWVRKLAEGDSQAQKNIWKSYVRRLNNYTRDRIKDRRESDEEDVVASVMASLFQRMGDGRLAPPENREKFWRLLRSMAKNKSAAVARRTTAQKRGGGEVGGESKFGNQRGGGIDMVPGNRSNDPHKLMESSEQFLSIISSLGSPDLQKVAILRMSNYSNLDIAEKLKCSTRTIERRLTLIRERLLAISTKEKSVDEAANDSSSNNSETDGTPPQTD